MSLHPAVEEFKKFVTGRFGSIRGRDEVYRPAHADSYILSEFDEFEKAHPHDESEDILPGWQADDAMQAAQQHLGKTLSYEDACTVLRLANKRFDANLGIDWDILGIHIDSLVEDGKITLLDWTDPEEETEE